MHVMKLAYGWIEFPDVNQIGWQKPERDPTFIT